MTIFSRRDFLVGSSASLLYTLAPASAQHTLTPASAEQPHASMVVPTDELLGWHHYGRLKLQRQSDSLVLQDGFLCSKETWQNSEFSFTARAPGDAEEVQIWAALRARDRDSRYLFGLRGGNNDHLYFARHAPQGGARFLGIAPLDFHPEPGQWYSLRAVAVENQFEIYLGDEPQPRIRVEDTDALWQQGGVCLGGGWLPAEFRNVSVRSLSPGEVAGDSSSPVYSFGSFDREQKRARERAAYRPLQIEASEEPRLEIPLNGNWLFYPDQDLTSGAKPQEEKLDDGAWHVMEVPNFWTPTLTWLHAEIGFPELPEVSAGKGLSDRLYEAELERLNNYTFSWKDTRSGWYRHHIDLPAEFEEQHLEICFDAVAKACQVWVNGIRVGSHIGMFGQVRCDISRAVRPGPNVIAVHVQGRLATEDTSTEIVGVAVTVPVTAAMLHSLPHGMYPEDASGIWQGVRLLVTQPVAVEDIFLEPRLDGLSFHLQVRNASAQSVDTHVSYTIRAVKDDAILYSSTPQAVRIGATGASFDFTTPLLKPALWSPQDPNLYFLEVMLHADGALVDRHRTRFGFRTFQVQGNTLLLNGEPLWLRAANHFPHALRPNDQELANRFMRLAREGNVIATRSHTAPFSATWLDAADEAGMCVSYEGTWPWLMLKGDPPAEPLLQIWKEEFASLIAQHRNHPSIILWTVNNEMKFESFDRNDPERLRQKWVILSDMVKTMRALDPTRPVVCDSSYCRHDVATEYENLIRPSGFDDGDIDDAHRYYGWYNPSFFHFFDGEFGNSAAWPGRPLISQEMASGYPRNDDGHPVRFYLFKHYTPQALVGDEAWEHRDPEIFLKRQAVMTKELGETIRRTNRDTCAGIFHFSYITWFRDAWSSEKIQQFVTYHALRKALQPVLVSAELYGRHFYAGQQIHTRVCIVHDGDERAPLAPSQLIWELRDGTSMLAHGSQRIPEIPYYANHWVDLSIAVPDALPRPRIDSSLLLRVVSEEREISVNDYDVLLATRAWAGQPLARAADGTADGAADVALLDLSGEAPERLRQLGLTVVRSIAQAKPGQPVVIAGAAHLLADDDQARMLEQFVRAGDRVLLLHPGASLAQRYAAWISGYRDCAGEIVSMQLPESKVFSGIEPLDLAWFERGSRKTPLACTGVYQVNLEAQVIPLASSVDFHGYLHRPEDVVNVGGSPLVEIRVGKGSIVASEMLLEAERADPIAGRLLSNLMRYLYDPDSAPSLASPALS